MKLNITPQSIWHNPIHFIAFGFGSGVMLVAPGTFGTIMAIPLYLLIQNFSLLWYLTILIVAILIGIKICDIAENDVGVRDHPGIVWDEIVGYGTTMIAAPKGWLWVLLGFILFRIFDIWKPQPIRWFNKNIHGGLGIIVDDLLAAIPAWLILQLVALLIYKSG